MSSQYTMYIASFLVYRRCTNDDSGIYDINLIVTNRNNNSTILTLFYNVDYIVSVGRIRITLKHILAYCKHSISHVETDLTLSECGQQKKYCSRLLNFILSHQEAIDITTIYSGDYISYCTMPWHIENNLFCPWEFWLLKIWSYCLWGRSNMYSLWN